LTYTEAEWRRDGPGPTRLQLPFSLKVHARRIADDQCVEKVYQRTCHRGKRIAAKARAMVSITYQETHRHD
jgi:hypothetical protein